MLYLGFKVHPIFYFCRRKKKKMRGGSVVMDWDQIVRHLSVSSNEAQAFRLTDGTHTTFWQSSGTMGKVSLLTTSGVPYEGRIVKLLVE